MVDPLLSLISGGAELVEPVACSLLVESVESTDCRVEVLLGPLETAFSLTGVVLYGRSALGERAADLCDDDPLDDLGADRHPARAVGGQRYR